MNETEVVELNVKWMMVWHDYSPEQQELLIQLWSFYPPYCLLLTTASDWITAQLIPIPTTVTINSFGTKSIMSLIIKHQHSLLNFIIFHPVPAKWFWICRAALKWCEPFVIPRMNYNNLLFLKVQYIISKSDPRHMTII